MNLLLNMDLHINYRQEISMKAEKYRKEIEDWDVDASSTMFIPDIRMRGR